MGRIILLRVLNNIPAYLVFVYFLNDHTHITTTKEGWKGALQFMHYLLVSNKHRLPKYIIEVFIDVKSIEKEYIID